jgi:hypothetical protein
MAARNKGHRSRVRLGQRERQLVFPCVLYEEIHMKKDNFGHEKYGSYDGGNDSVSRWEFGGNEPGGGGRQRTDLGKDRAS